MSDGFGERSEVKACQVCDAKGKMTHRKTLIVGDVLLWQVNT